MFTSKHELSLIKEREWRGE